MVTTSHTIRSRFEFSSTVPGPASAKYSEAKMIISPILQMMVLMLREAK